MHNLKKLLCVTILIIFLAVPFLALAQFGSTAPTGSNLQNKIIGCSPDQGVKCVVRSILLVLLALIFVVAVIFVVIGGYRFVVSQGNEEAVTDAKKTITWAIGGMVVAALAWVIVITVLSVVETGDAKKGGAGGQNNPPGQQFPRLPDGSPGPLPPP